MHSTEQLAVACRSVVNYSGSLGQDQSGLAIKLFQRLEKLVIPSIFDTSIASFMM